MLFPCAFGWYKFVIYANKDEMKIGSLIILRPSRICSFSVVTERNTVLTHWSSALDPLSLGVAAVGR